MSEDKKFYELFPDKTLSDVYKNIYDNSTKTRNQITGLIDQLKPFVKSLDSAATIVPLIREYMEILVRNDEHLIKLADSATRLLKEGKVGTDESGGFLSDEEKAQILNNATEYNEYVKVTEKDKATLDERVEEIKAELLSKEEIS
jgi:hypothetical protein